MVWLDVGSAAKYTAGVVGTDGDNIRAPGPRRTVTEMGDKDRVLSDGAAVHSERD